MPKKYKTAYFQSLLEIAFGNNLNLAPHTGRAPRASEAEGDTGDFRTIQAFQC